MIVQCNRECFDSKRARKYYIGDQDDVDPTEPLAMYFTFPPGTETYFKEMGTNGEFVTGVRSNVAAPKPVKVDEKPEPEKPVAKKRAKKRPQRKPKPVPEVQEHEWPTAPLES